MSSRSLAIGRPALSLYFQLIALAKLFFQGETLGVRRSLARGSHAARCWLPQ